jgi:hypothetical protein
MGSLLFGLVAGSGLTWVFMELCRDGYWREFSTRRRGSNPPPPGRKPAPSARPPHASPAVLADVEAWLRGRPVASIEPIITKTP